ncbi:triose-phosphate isomerase [Ampullimonas aquatilis]|uniref:triose-phosphate isomerase n=1 Tax=Ampullimonas aquatilis TaxID=1341549 RepID=UPI003C7311DB
MQKKLVAGNWKMNGGLASNQSLVEAIGRGLAKLSLNGVDVAICPPAAYLAQCQQLVAATPIKLGSQDISVHDSGAYTGEIAAAMLSEFTVRYVIVGHSERRAYHGESDELVAAKALKALQAGLTPIVCVGETLAERESDVTEQVIARQLNAVMAVLAAEQLAKVVIAYEPVWAIGTGKSATSAQAQAVHAFIRAKLQERIAEAAKAVKILYGGSVKANNAAEIFSMADIDGGLIGGAALIADDFLQIVEAAID